MSNNQMSEICRHVVLGSLQKGFERALKTKSVKQNAKRGRTQVS